MIFIEIAKINFDSGIREWRNDFIKWRYLIFNDNKNIFNGTKIEE